MISKFESNKNREINLIEILEGINPLARTKFPNSSQIRIEEKN